MTFKGIMVPLITPLQENGILDEDGLENLVEHTIEGDVNGLFVLGSTGEGPCLNYRLRREVIDHVCRYTRGRVPVMVSVADTSMDESIRLAKAAAEAGASNVVLALPYYFPLGQAEIRQYIHRIISELPLPVMLYNMPSLTKVWFEIETLKALASYESITGVKDSSGDLDYYAQLCELKSERPDWSILIGPEEKLIESVGLGGDGGVNGGANLYPRLFVNAYEAAVSGDREKCEELQGIIENLGEMYEVGPNGSRFIKATKCAASILGLCNDAMAEPFDRFSPQNRSKVDAILKCLDPQLL